MKVELPYFVEKALTSDYGTADLHPRVNQFNQKVLEYCSWWMKQLDLDVPEEVTQQLLRLYLADADCNFFFNVSSQGLRGDSPEAAEYNGPCGKLPPGGASRFFVQNMNHFHAAGGYSAMLLRLQRERPIPVHELNCYVKTLEIPKRCYEPTWVATELQHLVKAALHRSSHGTDADYNDLAEGQGTHGTMYRLMSTLLKDLVPTAGSAARVKVFDDSITVAQLKEEWRAQVGIRVLGHKRLAVRLRGVDMLDALAREALRASKILPMYTAGAYKRERCTEFFDAESFAEYAFQQSAIECMLDLHVVPADSVAAEEAKSRGKTVLAACKPGHVAIPGSHGVHVQLVKSAAEFAMLLVLSTTKLSSEMVDLLMYSAERDGSQAAITAVHDLIVHAADVVDASELPALFARLSSKPVASWEQGDVELLKNFTFAACKNMAYEMSREGGDPTTVGAVAIPAESAFALPVFWQALTSGKVGQVQKPMQSAFVQLIAQVSLRHNALDYLQQCIAAVEERRSSMQHLQLASAMLAVLPGVAGGAQQAHSQEHVLKQLCEGRDLVQLLLGELQEYKEKAVAAAEAAGTTPVCRAEGPLQASATAVWRGEPADEPAATGVLAADDLVVSGTEHTSAVSTRLDFLQRIVASSTAEMSQSVAEQLFAATAGSNVTHAEKEKFMCWLRELQFGTVTHRTSPDNAPLQLAAQESVFTGLLCRAGTKRFVGVRDEGFKTFEAFFKAVNKQQGKLRAIGNGKLETLDANLVGLPALWAMTVQVCICTFNRGPSVCHGRFSFAGGIGISSGCGNEAAHLPASGSSP